MQEGGLVAVPFDLNRLEVTGNSVVVANDVAFDPLTGVLILLSPIREIWFTSPKVLFPKT